MFIPFLGALITLKQLPDDAWNEAKVAIAGPILGALGAAAVWGLGEWLDSDLLVALAFTGFFLNLFNLAPICPLDGGRIVAAIHPALWIVGLAAPGRAHDPGAEPDPDPDPRPRRARVVAALAAPGRPGGEAYYQRDAGAALDHRGLLHRARGAPDARDERHVRRARHLMASTSGGSSSARTTTSRTTSRSSRPSSSAASRRCSRSTGRRSRSSARPASARTPGRTRRRARRRRLFAEARLRRRDRRRPRRDGGGEPRLQGGRRPLGRLQHRRSRTSRASTRTSTSR